MTEEGIEAFEVDSRRARLRRIDTYEPVRPGQSVWALAADPEGSFLALATAGGSKSPVGLEVHGIDPETGRLSLRHAGLWHPEGRAGEVRGLVATRDCVVVTGGATILSYRVATGGSLTLADALDMPLERRRIEQLTADPTGRWLFSFFAPGDDLASWFVEPDCRLREQPAIHVPVRDESHYLAEMAVGAELIVLSHRYESWRPAPPYRLRLLLLEFDPASGTARLVGEALETTERGFGGPTLGPGRLLVFGGRSFGYSTGDSSPRLYRVGEDGRLRLLGSLPVVGTRVFHFPKQELFVADASSGMLYGYGVDEAGALRTLGQAAVDGLSSGYGLPAAAMVAVTPRSNEVFQAFVQPGTVSTGLGGR